MLAHRPCLSIVIYIWVFLKGIEMSSFEPTPPSIDPEIPPIVINVNCEATHVNDLFFPTTHLGEIALSTAKCEPGGFPVASVLCGSKTENGIRNHNGFVIDSFILLDCDENPFLQTGIKENISNKELKRLIQKVQLRLFGQQLQPIKSQEISNVLQFFEKVKGKGKDRTFNISANSTLRYMISTLAMVTKHFNVTSAKALSQKQKIAELFPALMLLSQFSNGQQQLNINNGIMSTKIEDNRQLAGQNITFTPKREGSQPSVSLFVPETVLRNAERKASIETDEFASIRTVFISYESDILFPSRNKALNVLSVNVGQDPSANSNLKDPVIIRHENLQEKPEKRKMPHTNLTLNETVLSCVYWDFSLSDWSDKGCAMSYSNGTVECKCHHLTNFALLVSYQTVPNNFALELASIIGCTLSIVGLLATILLLAVRRELRKHEPGKILLHLCCNLCISYIIFLSGVSYAIGDSVACSIVTFLLHYFLLATWAWMGIYSFEMYIEVVKVFNTYYTKFMIKASATAYGISALIAGSTIGISLSLQPQQSTGLNNVPYYFSDNACWLTGYSLAIGFLLPVALVLLCNVIVFFSVISELRKKKKNTHNYPGKSKYSAKSLLIMAMTTTFLTGLTWIFGYLLIFTTNDSFYNLLSWLFSLSSALQGFVIFILTIVRRNKTRKMWWNTVTAVFRTESYKHSIVSTTGSSSPKISSLRSNPSVNKKSSNGFSYATK